MDADAFQDQIDIKRDQSVPAPLREHSKRNNDHHTPSVSRCGPECRPRRLTGCFLFELEGMTDLRHFEHYKRLASIAAVCMIARQDPRGFGFL